MLGSVESVLVPPPAIVGTAANGNANPSKVASVGAVNVCATAAMGYLIGRNLKKFGMILYTSSRKDIKLIKALQDWLAKASTKSIRHRVW